MITKQELLGAEEMTKHEQWIELAPELATPGLILDDIHALETADLGDGDFAAYDLGHGRAEVVRVGADTGHGQYHTLVRFLDIEAAGIQPSREW